MSGFQLDTSGTVPFLTVEGHPDAMAWSDLDAFTQGYIEALFAWWQEQLRTSGKSSAYIVSLLRYDRLAHEALARIIEDCELSHSHWCMPRDTASGRRFWEMRQSPRERTSTFPPLTVILGDDGKVYLSEPKSESLSTRGGE